MCSDLWPDVPQAEIPITSITNGVHAQTWMAPEMADAHPPPGARVARAGRTLGAPARRPRLRVLARPRAGPRGAGRVRPPAVGHQPMARGAPERRRVDRLGARPPCAHHRLRPSLRHLQARHAAPLTSRSAQGPLLSGDRPVQLVFAGKAHPADDAARTHPPGDRPSPPTRSPRRVVFLEDYDMAVARDLLQGVDVWLNNPADPSRLAARPA